jgi:hypothetical protein
MLKKSFTKYRYAFIFGIILLVYFEYCIGRIYGFTYFPDEFGYWTYAASMSGYDWSDIASLGSYYSYGYSLVLFPIFKLFTDAVMAYRVAVGLNYVLIGVSYILIAWLGRKLLKLSKDESYIAAAVAALYPGMLFYAKSTMVETMLSVMYIVICTLIYYYIDNNRTGTLILITASLVYIYFLHMRAVGILAAGIITILVYKARKILKPQNILKAFIGLIALVAIIATGVFLKNWLQGTLYSDNNMLSVNDYSGQFWKFRIIFTKDGILDFIEGLAGKILYMGLATYGLAWFGLAYSARNSLKIKYDKHNVIYIFIILSTIFELIINTIFNIHPQRVDGVTYGRYHEFVFPILMILGICELKNTTRQLVKTAMIIIAQLPLMLLAVHCIERYGLTQFRGYFISGISLLYGIGDTSPSSFMWKAYISGSILIVITVILVLLARNGKELRKLLVYGIALIELVYVVRVSQIYTDKFELASYRDMTIASKIESLIKEDDSRRILYIPNGDEQYIGILQFAMRDEDIEILPVKNSLYDYDSEEIGEKDILVLFFQNPYTDEAAELYNCGLLNGRFYIYYNR